jgi:16S rRNA (uracil1498-N3)-methyltransferase
MAEPGAKGPAAIAATAHVYVDRLDDSVVVDGDDGHHLQRARRVRAGEVITASDGYGRWRVYGVTSAGGGVVALAATSGLGHEVQLAPRLAVACALTKGEKPELVVQKLTELGADRIVLVQAARSVVRWDGGRAATAVDRLQRIAREAGAQCRRARVPVVDGPVTPSELLDHPGLVLADATGDTADELGLPAGGEWLVAVGPEGGFDDAERAAFGSVPRLRLGPFVLRAETAAIAAAAALAARRDSGPTDRREW